MSVFTRNISQIVVLMLENRSFDHMLGFAGLGAGLSGSESNDPVPTQPGQSVKVSKDAAYTGDLVVDPSHRFEDINIQLFGVASPPVPPPAKTNIGFVLNYAQQPGVTAATAPNIMKCFDPTRLPALTTLAQEFVVCDQWFSSVPAQTWPNRFFMHAATSMGQIDNQSRVYSCRTVYDNLSDAEIDWRVYFHDLPQCIMLASLRKPAYRKNFKVFAERFALDCMTGLLPQYSFIEPRYFDFLSFKANDQHPPHDVALGDHLVADVYEAIRNSPMWDTTLLVILWDEHGGLYDHVLPPATVNPDGLIHQSPDFDFTRLGLRVPAVLVSPYLERGKVDSTIYDHTSVLASAKELFDLSDFLTRRDAAANTVGHLVTDSKRTGTPMTLPRAQADVPLPVAPTTSLMTADQMAATLPMASGAPLSEFQESLIGLTKTLPPPADPRLRISLDASQPVDEHAAAVHVRQAFQQFLAGD